MYWAFFSPSNHAKNKQCMSGFCSKSSQPFGTWTNGFQGVAVNPMVQAQANTNDP